MPIYKLHVKRTFVFAILGVILAAIVGLLSPKIYEGRMQILVGANAPTRPMPIMYPDVQEILDAGSSKDTPSELDVVRGEGVFGEALRNVCKRYNVPFRKDLADQMYLMYDVVSQKETSVGMVTVKSSIGPQFAADVANEVGDVYNDLRRRSAQAAVRNAQVYLDRQVVDARKELFDAQANLEKFKTHSGVIDVPTFYTRSTEAVVMLQQNLAAAQADLSGAKAEVVSLRTQLGGMSANYEDSQIAVKNPVVQQLESQLADLRSKRDQLLSHYMEDSVQVKEIDGTIVGIEKRLADERNATIVQQRSQREDPLHQLLKQNLANAEARLASDEKRATSLMGSIAGAEAINKGLPPSEAEIAKLDTERTIADMKYRRVKAQADDLKFKTEAAARAAQILYRAETNDEPVAPVYSKLMLIGLLAGVMIGLLYSYTIEGMKLRVYTSSQLAELTGLPVFASVPSLPKPQARRLLRSLTSRAPAIMESFRFMAYSSLPQTGKSRSVLFTGVGAEVGCSTAAAQYASAAARAGTKVILVDYDLQSSTLTRLFGLQGRSGVRDVLSKTMLPSDTASLAVEGPHENLRIVPAGAGEGFEMGDAPHSLFGGFVAKLTEQADLVVIDAPPVDRVVDASRLVPYVDEVCLVVSAATTNYRHIPMAQEILRRAGAKSVGLVLTGVNQEEEPFSTESPFLTEKAS